MISRRLLGSLVLLSAAGHVAAPSDAAVSACGGLAGVQCRAAHWCDFPDVVICGIGDAEGASKPIPEVCPELDDPACGCDSSDYGNAGKGQSGRVNPGQP